MLVNNNQVKLVHCIRYVAFSEKLHYSPPTHFVWVPRIFKTSKFVPVSPGFAVVLPPHFDT